LNIDPTFLFVGNFPSIPKYSNWEDYIANPSSVVPKHSIGFEVNKGGRPAVIIEEQKPKYDFSKNEKDVKIFQKLRTQSSLKYK
jgi:hypothetical protein